MISRDAAQESLGPRPYDTMRGWAEGDWTSAWTVFRETAAAIAAGQPSLRSAVSPSPDLVGVFEIARTSASRLGADEARAFFETYFMPCDIRLPGSQAGFLTGYYEPVVRGQRHRSKECTAPILARPIDLLTFTTEELPASMPSGYSAGVLDAAGILRPYRDRAALEAFALTEAAAPIVWLRDWAEVFMIHVQGSARVQFPDGSEQRLVYAGRNGHPYTSIGRRLIDRGKIAAEDMSLDRLKAWLREHGQEPGQDGRRLMQENASYIFFRLESIDDPAGGPIGGAGLPLNALTSIAVDRERYAYGLPFWIETATPLPGFGDRPLARLFVAQDTGSAIVGPARADLFMGSGDNAGTSAGLIRHAARVTVLLPRPA